VRPEQQSAIGTRQSAIANAFSMVELLVAMTLLSLIVLVLMAVFSSTQQAFRASITQTDVLEGSRAAVDMIATDLRTMTPSDGASNWTNGPVNFFTVDNSYSQSLYYQPLVQSLPGSPTASQRVNVLNYFFLLGRNNQTWTAVGYAVDATNTAPLYPLYRFYGETNISVPPVTLYWNFVNAINQSQWTNLSHVMDGVVHLVVRAYDNNGVWLTNGYGFTQTNRPQNVWFAPPVLGEVGCYFFSNAVPAAVELELGVLEDRTLQRAESLPNVSPAWAQSNYLSQQSSHVHLFRQRVTIPNVDPSAYP
jgi:type II secretory pathway pseudopilin PulG